MIYFVLLFVEVAIMFLFSREISKTLSKFTSINFLSFLLLPGVIIHELSHLFMAVILFVHVGDIEFTPHRDGERVKLGSVEIAKTDPIRRSVIGFAPVLLGLMIIVGIVYLFTNNILFFKDKNPYIFLASILGIAYILFAISNTMFSSSRDMEGTIETIVVLLIIVILLYVLGVRVPLSLIGSLLERNVSLIQKSVIFLLAPIVIDLFILGIIKIFTGRKNQTGQI